MVKPDPLIRIAVNVPLSRTFDYRHNDDGPVPDPGCRVTVPFGRRREIGLVIGHSSDSAIPDKKLRKTGPCLDDRPLLSPDDLWLIQFTSDYYHHPIGEVVSAALPALLRQGKPLHPLIERIAATDAGENADFESLTRRAPKQAELLGTLVDAAAMVVTPTA